MTSLFADLQIRSIAVHEVFVRDPDQQVVAPRCSDALAELPQDGVAALRERIVKAMGSNSKSMEMSIEDYDVGTTFALCAYALAATEHKFLKISKQVAQRLAGAQWSRAIPGGVVVMLRGSTGLDGRRFVGVIKAEVHSGFLKESGNGGPVIRFLDSLLLTPQQKLHKIGIFVENEPGNARPDALPDEFSAFVFDSQMSGSEIASAANYFYEQFLGCKPAPTAKRLTRDFYERSKQFITTTEFDPEVKIECVTALHSYLRSNRPTVHVREFAEDFLPADAIQPYLDHFDTADFPDIAVHKDITAIKRKLRLRKLSFTTDVRISAPAERFDELVTIEGSTEAGTLVRIKGRLAGQE